MVSKSAYFLLYFHATVHLIRSFFKKKKHFHEYPSDLACNIEECMGAWKSNEPLSSVTLKILDGSFCYQLELKAIVHNLKIL